MTPRRSLRLQSKREQTPRGPYEPRGPRAMMKLNKSRNLNPTITISTPSQTAIATTQVEEVKNFFNKSNLVL